jgi:hypothetical protein
MSLNMNTGTYFHPANGTLKNLKINSRMNLPGSISGFQPSKVKTSPLHLDIPTGLNV